MKITTWLSNVLAVLFVALIALAKIPAVLCSGMWICGVIATGFGVVATRAIGRML